VSLISKNDLLFSYFFLKGLGMLVIKLYFVWFCLRWGCPIKVVQKGSVLCEFSTQTFKWLPNLLWIFGMLMSRDKGSSPHDELKRWLLELGKKVTDAKGKPYYEVYSGDSQLVHIGLGKKHVPYQPDVVWDRNGKLWLIEIAFNEDWRSIVGELALTSAVKNPSGIFIITYGWDEDFIPNLLPLFGDKFNIEWAYESFSDEEYSDLETMKKLIKKDLEKWEWI
jgi:hypothetical protein